MGHEICLHSFLEEESCKICELCGLEIDLLINDNRSFGNLGTTKSCSSYSVKLPQEDYNKYLEDIPIDLKKSIITRFEQLLQKVNLRGEGKKALLAACFFFLFSKYKSTTAGDVISRFKLVKKKYSVGIHAYLDHFPDDRDMEKRISDFVEVIFEKFNLPLHLQEEAKESAKLVDSHPSFVNMNPHAVCACIIFKLLTEKGEMKIKKNLYIKTVKMSDVTVQNINTKLQGLQEYTKTMSVV